MPHDYKRVLLEVEKELLGAALSQAESQKAFQSLQMQKLSMVKLQRWDYIDIMSKHVEIEDFYL